MGVDHSRQLDGFTVLQGGQDGGRAASLIRPDQVASAVNITMRGSYGKTRPPFTNLPFTYESTVTQSRFTGIFQGAMFYDIGDGTGLHIVSMGGRLFTITIVDGNNLVSEITPKLSIVVTADFTVPAPGANVTIEVTSESVINPGDIIYIDSGQYNVANTFTNGLIITYVSGAANATVSTGASVLDVNQAQIIEYRENPSSLDFVFMFQAENYAIILGGQHKTVIFDGSSSRLAGPLEIPTGVLGIYIWGRIWIVLPDRRTFVAGDIVFGPSGTAQNGYRDAILSFTENDFLNEGGAFGVPRNSGPITAMQTLATQDTSLGQGNLLVGTTNMIFSVNTPIDRTTWKNLTYPIQTVALIDYGPTGPRNTNSINGDMWYRGADGWRSFMVARRDFGTWGNTPMSREMSPVTDFDTEDLLFYGSSILFDNKYFGTVSPYRSELGIAHRGLGVINFDLLSSLQGKSTPAWEGVYTGIDVLQLTKGSIHGKERGFAFVRNCAGELELWELLKTGYYDVFQTRSGDSRTITRNAIQASLNTRAMAFNMPFVLKSLRMADLFIDEIVDDVQIVIKFRPDQYPNWSTWTTISLCANVEQCTVQGQTGLTCSVWKTRAQQYAARVRLPKPPESCNTVANGQMTEGYEFQFRLEITGHCRIRGFRPHANVRSEPSEGTCPETPECTTIESCAEDYFTYTAHCDTSGGGSSGTTYYNAQQTYTASCPAGQVGSDVTVTIPAGTYSSPSNQADADAQALGAATAQATALLSCTGSGCSNDVPVMTSDTAPSGEASASTNNATAYLAFNGNRISSGWSGTVRPPGWLQYKFAAAKTLRAYRLFSNSTSYMPTAWLFQGSNNGTAWTTLDTQTGQSFTLGVGNLYTFANVAAYLYYRIYVTATPPASGSSAQKPPGIFEMELFSCTTPPP